MRALFLVPLLLLLAPAARAADHFTVGSWNGGAQYDASGNFQRCSMTGEFMPGEFVTFSNTADGSLAITLTNKHIALTAGQSRPAEITSDFPPLPALITNYDANSAGMTFADPGPIYQRLRVASWVAINSDHGQAMVYPLNLVNRGLQRLLACTMRGMGFTDYGTQAVGDPFGAGIPYPADTDSTQSVGHSPISTAQFHPLDPAALSQLANDLLARADIVEKHFLAAGERQNLAPGFPLVWIDSAGTGGALVGYELASPHAPMSFLVEMTGTLTLYNDAASCQGLFDSRIEDLTTKAGFPARRIHTVCQRPDLQNAYMADYMIFAPAPHRLVKLGVARRGLAGHEKDSTAPHSDALLTAALQALRSEPTE